MTTHCPECGHELEWNIELGDYDRCAGCGRVWCESELDDLELQQIREGLEHTIKDPFPHRKGGVPKSRSYYTYANILLPPSPDMNGLRAIRGLETFDMTLDSNPSLPADTPIPPIIIEEDNDA